MIELIYTGSTSLDEEDRSSILKEMKFISNSLKLSEDLDNLFPQDYDARLSSAILTSTGEH